MALSGFTHAGNYRRLTRATTSDVWTVAAWVYPTSSVQYMTPIETEDSGLVCILRSGAGSYWTADYVGNAANYARNTGITVDLNAWQLVVATIDATTSTNQFVVYKGSGGSITSDSWSTAGGATSKTLTNWYQYQPSVGGRHFQGRIALAAVWNTVLSSTDVAALYNGGDGVDPATIQSSFIRISNYFDDQELSIDGATDGSSTYTDFGTLTTVAGPFTPPSVSITPAATSHAHAADSPTVTQTHSITVADSSHAHAAESPVVTQTHAVSTNEAAHSHTAGSAAVTQTHVVATAEALHAHTADNTTATVGGVTISADAADHGHAADSPVVTQIASVSPQEATHSHSVDAAVVTQTHIVSAADASHAHAADVVTLTVSASVSVASADHAHYADTPTVTQTHVVIVADASHAHAADAPVLTQTVYVLAVFTHTLHGAASSPELSISNTAPTLHGERSAIILEG